MKKLFMIISIVFLLIFTFSCQKQGEKELTVEEAKTINDGYLKFRNEGDLASADKVFHPDCVIKYPNLPNDIVGLDAFKEYDKRTRSAFPDFKMTINKFFVKDDKIVVYWDLDATNTGPMMTPMGELPPTNKKVHLSGIAVSTIVDGKIKEDQAYFDMMSMMMQLGFTIAPPKTEQGPEEIK